MYLYLNYYLIKKYITAYHFRRSEKSYFKTIKSILLPCVIKALCNNLEANRLINVMGHGISTDLIREIDTENALHTINHSPSSNFGTSGCILCFRCDAAHHLMWETRQAQCPSSRIESMVPPVRVFKASAEHNANPVLVT